MLISRARRFYERTATLRDNLAAGGAFAMATVALALLTSAVFAGPSDPSLFNLWLYTFAVIVIRPPESRIAH